MEFFSLVSQLQGFAISLPQDLDIVPLSFAYLALVAFGAILT
jgi:hypothetical protein